MMQIATITFRPFNNERQYQDAVATVDVGLFQHGHDGEIVLEGDGDRVDEALSQMRDWFDIQDVEREAAAA